MRKLKKAIFKFIKKRRETFYCYRLRKKVKNRNFTIISNNCWGGGVYEDLGMQYNTPTVGLFFYAPCYIRFLKNFHHYLNTPLSFKKSSIYEEANEVRKNNPYPIGALNDIEIHFLHYKSEGEALEKWNKRVTRINQENLFISFCDRDFCTEAHLHEFDKLTFTRKICFSAKAYPHLKSVVYLKRYKNQPSVGILYTDKWGYRKDFDVAKWLNEHE